VRFKENNKLNPTKRSKPKSMQSKGNQTHGARIIIQSATALMKLCSTSKIPLASVNVGR
jgi:hypothetical protein